jgi:[amino group carrier protein]-lysine/ornithine hydrolase
MERAAAVDLVRGLVAIPSVSTHEGPAAAWLVNQMRAHGFDRAFVDDAGNAVGELGDVAARRTIVLLGHIDTVPGNIPVRIDGKLLYGRGSVDAKGPLATFVAASARFGSAAAQAAHARVVVVGAVEEEAATSKGARFIASRFNGTAERIPDACIIGEPSRWNRITLGYKGRLLLDLTADQPMAHTAGPDASVASAVVDLWNWVTGHAAEVNAGKDTAFDQLTPSLRRFITATTEHMHDTVDAQFAWRLPVGFDADEFMQLIEAQIPKPSRLRQGYGGQASPQASAKATAGKQALTPTFKLSFRGYEKAWRGDRTNPLVRSFLAGLRSFAASEKLGFVLKTGTSDMNVVAPVWKCPVAAYGPGDSALDHTPNEHLDLDEYWKAVQVLEQTLHAYVEPGL